METETTTDTGEGFALPPSAVMMDGSTIDALWNLQSHDLISRQELRWLLGLEDTPS